MAAGEDKNICEIFADTDSEYDEEFEGFDINVDDENMEVIGCVFLHTAQSLSIYIYPLLTTCETHQ